MTWVAPNEFLDACRACIAAELRESQEIAKIEATNQPMEAIATQDSPMMACPACGQAVQQKGDRLAVHFADPRSTRPCPMSWPQNKVKPKATATRG